MSEPTPITSDSPWPWLEPFAENASTTFGGRDEDIQTMLRRVVTTTVCLLFGKSGLGKTSLLNAGLFPLLRDRRMLPVPIRRLEYGPKAAQVSAQLMSALDTAVANATTKLHWSQPASDSPEDAVTALWERLHERDHHLVDDTGARWTPVFVLDQFEEIFTLETDAQRRQRTFEELGDLLENRIPPAVARRLDADDESIGRLSIDSQSYRFLVSIREDFLPELEFWTRLVPRLGPNRYRLMPLSAEAARQSILKTGGALVDEAAADAIVGFLDRHAAPGVAMREDRRIEPALLSLICASLNADRLAKKPPPQRLDVSNLDQRGAEILDVFYDRAFAAVDAKIRTTTEEWVETNLITGSGWRRPYPFDDVIEPVKSALKVLEAHRLLRRTERGDIELVHDRLAGVARQRALARLRLAEEATRARVQARRFVAVLAVVVIVAVGLGFVLWQQARLDEYQARLDESKAQAQRDAEEKQASEVAQTARDRLDEAAALAKEAAAVAAVRETPATSQLIKQATDLQGMVALERKKLEDCPSGRRVYPQLAQGTDPAVLDRATKALRDAGFIVPHVQFMPNEKMPRTSELRYFINSEADVKAAKDAFAALGNARLTNVLLKFVDGYQNSPGIRACHYELWIAPGS